MQNETYSLKSDVIGLVGAATMGVVVLSPAMTLYGGFGPTFLNAGKAAPLAMIWAFLATLPTAISYSLLSRDYPLSGSVASWMGLFAPRWLAAWVGWLVVLYYFCNFVIEPVAVGVFAGDLFAAAGVKPNFLTYAFGGIVCCVWGAWIVYRGISLSTKSALAFLLFEIGVVTALCATIIWVAVKTGTHLGTEGFHLSGSPTGAGGLFKAMVFATLAYCGFDVVSTLAEETKMAKSLIPQATMLSLGMYAFLIIGGIWVLTYGGDSEHLRKVAEAGQMPISEVARSYWGSGGLWVSLTALSASLGLTIAVAVGTSRILYSMGRDGTAPRFLAALHPEHKVPWNALHVIFGLGLVSALISGALLGAYDAYNWWGGTVAYFALLTYLFSHVANLALNGRLAFRSVGAFLGYLVVPAVGIAVDAYLIERTFFVELWSQNWATGKSIIVFDLGCTALALATACAYCMRRPAVVPVAVKSG